MDRYWIDEKTGWEYDLEIYPSSCYSINCGKIDCGKCIGIERLNMHKEYVKRKEQQNGIA